MPHPMRIILTALLIQSISTAAAPAADLPKQQLPSQEPTLKQDEERGPRVITNPQPTIEDRVGATEVKDADPTTVESVEKSPLPRYIAPGGERFMVRRAVARKTMALALGGGGARGCAHIGVLKVLEQERIPIDYIVGNSMGSVIGGLYSVGVPCEQLAGFGRKGGLRKKYMPGVTARLALMPLSKLLAPFRKDKLAGLVSGEKFEKHLQSMIPEGKNDFKFLKIPFSAVATNLTDGKAYRISEGKLSTALRASSSIPPLLRPVRIDNKVYVDGGVRANLPASSARDTGADVVIAVLVDEPLREVPEKSFYTYRGIASRMGDIVLSITDEHQLQFADVVINPDVSGIPTLSERPEDVAKAIAEGEKAARKALPIIRQKMNLPQGSELVRIDVPTI